VSLLPNFDELYHMLHTLDWTYKTQMMVYNLQGVIYWTSFYEIALWILMFFIFFAAPVKFAIVFVHLFHVARGVLGFKLLNKLPKSDELIDGIRFEEVQAET